MTSHDQKAEDERGNYHRDDNAAYLYPLRYDVQQESDDLGHAAGEGRLDQHRIRGCGMRLQDCNRRMQGSSDGGELCCDHDLLRDRFTHQWRTGNMHRAIELAADRAAHAGHDANRRR